ncbi:MAG: guanylate kinase [Clostridia bacterium]|nr:guanylate kinase [Clostridia bacterium]
MSKKRNNLLLVVSGPSGSGKNTLISCILDNRDNVSHSVSATTRAPRGDEKNGVAYYFMTFDEFERTVEEGGFYEHDVYRENRYGTLKADVIKRVAAGDNVVLDLTVPGAVNLKKEFGERAKTVFIIPPSMKILKERLIARGTDPMDVIERRMRFALESEIDRYREFDYVIYNDVLEDAKKAILLIYDSLTTGDKNVKKAAEKLKTVNSTEFAEKIVDRFKKEADMI